MFQKFENEFLAGLVLCFGLTAVLATWIIIQPQPERTLMCDDKLIVKSNKLYLDNNMWVWDAGTYTPAGGEICVLVLDNRGEDK